MPDEWGPCWESRHQVLSRLAGYFHVVWMNHPHGWRDCFSALRRRLGFFDGISDKTCELCRSTNRSSGFRLLGRPAWLAHFTSQQRLKLPRDLLRARGCTRFVLYIWRPEFAGAIEDIQHDLSIYHVDDEYSFSSTEVEVSLAERRLLESVGQVFIHSPALMQKKGWIQPQHRIRAQWCGLQALCDARARARRSAQHPTAPDRIRGHSQARC